MQESEIYRLDRHQFDTIILGTDLPQALMAAHLAKLRKESVLVIDLNRSYCSDISTVTLRELKGMLLSPEVTKKLPHYQLAGPPEWREQALQYIRKCEEDKLAGGFSLDLDPRLLFGCGLPTNLMKQAEMDKYLEFIPVKDICVLQQDKEHIVPFTKGDIFKSSLLTLKEKKELYNALQVTHQLGKRLSLVTDDPNSLNEFNKENKLDEAWYDKLEGIKEEGCERLVQMLGVSDRVAYLFYYVIAGYLDAPQGRATVRDFLGRVSRFIQSCGIYTKTPYLMIGYGSADVGQAFSRIASVFGSTYVLSPTIKLHSLEQHDTHLALKTSLHDSELTCKRVLMGSEYSLLSQPPIKSQSTITVIVGQAETSRDSYPVIVHIPAGYSNSYPAILYDVGKSLSSARAQRTWYLRGHVKDDCAGLATQIIKQYQIKPDFIVCFRHNYYGGAEGGDKRVQVAPSQEEIGFDSPFQWFAGHEWAGQGPFFRLEGEETVREMTDDSEMEAVLKGIEKAFQQNA